MVMESNPTEKNIWTSVTTQGPTPLPHSLHTAVLIKNKVYLFGGWVPVVLEDGSVPHHKTPHKAFKSINYNWSENDLQT